MVKMSTAAPTKPIIQSPPRVSNGLDETSQWPITPAHDSGETAISARRGCFITCTVSNVWADFLVGDSSADADVLERVIYVRERESTSSGHEVRLKFFIPNREETITEIRNELFLSIGAVVFIFGFVLQQTSWTIRDRRA